MITVIGDIIIDEYIYGTSNRISPEAPVPVITFQNKKRVSGGASNVYDNIRSLHKDVAIGTTCLNDPPVKQRIICDDHYVSRIDYNDTNRKWENKHYPDTTLYVLSDYDKGAIQTPLHIDFLNTKTIVDPKKHLSEYSGVYCIKCNKKEFQEYAGLFDDDATLRVKMMLAVEFLNIQHLIVTLGSKGVAYCSSNEYHLIKGIPQQTFDVTGAGDTFLAVLAVYLEKGYSMLEAVKVANKAASISVTKQGTYVIKPEDFDYEKIVFTNGCFDILHIGHLDYLKKSKELGTKLIVGLNSDESVKKLKGHTRPINNQYIRKQMLEHFTFVDEVVIFDEETPYNLIKQIKPHVITKGGDYVKECVVGYDLAEVVIIPFEYDISTTSIVEKV